MIIRGGANIYPREIEEVLYQHPDIMDAAVIGIPDARLGERTCACVVPRPGRTLGFDDVVGFLRPKIATYKLPEVVEILPDLPRTPTGKIQKEPLRALILRRLRSAQGTTAQGTTAQGTTTPSTTPVRPPRGQQHERRGRNDAYHRSALALVHRRGYVLQTEAELAQQHGTWRSSPSYRTEEEMAQDFAQANVRTILDFGFTKFLPLDQAAPLHDYGFATQRRFPDGDHRQLAALPARTWHSRPRRIPPLPRHSLRLRRAVRLGRRRPAGKRSGLVPVLRPVHPGQGPGADLRRHDRPRRRFPRRHGHRARQLPSAPSRSGRGTVPRPDHHRRPSRLAVAVRDDRHPVAQGQRLVRAARLVAALPDRRAKTRDLPPAAGPRLFGADYPLLHLRPAARRLGAARPVRPRCWKSCSTATPSACSPSSGTTLTLAGDRRAAMNLGLAGRVALVNGASQGIGYGIAHTLARRRRPRGHRRAPHAGAPANRRRTDRARDRRQVLPIQCDIRRAEDCERVVARRSTISVRCTLWSTTTARRRLGGLLEFDDEAWRKAVEQNLMSVVRLTRAAVPHMKAAGGGSILNITAISMLEPKPGFGLSVATWAAVMGFAKTASIELGRDGITINTIAPGLVETPRLHRVTEQSGKVMGDFAAGIPLGRVGTPADIAALVALLVSPRGAYITGTTIPVDGGLLAGVR